MRKFLASIFGRKARPSPRPAQPRLGLVELNQRVLPNASPMGMAFGRFGGRQPPGMMASAVAGGEAGPAQMGRANRGDHGECGHGAQATLAATLSDESGATAAVSYNADSGTLQVRVSGAEANASLEVTVAGTSVGTVTTNDEGRGSLRVDDVTAAAGDAVTVGTLEGTLSQVRFSATLTGESDASGTASYDSVRNRLSVSVTGAAADTTYDVSVGGTVVGQLTTNAAGRGRLKLTPSALTIAAGTTVAVVGADGVAILNGTFE